MLKEYTRSEIWCNIIISSNSEDIKWYWLIIGWDWSEKEIDNIGSVTSSHGEISISEISFCGSNIFLNFSHMESVMCNNFWTTCWDRKVLLNPSLESFSICSSDNCFAIGDITSSISNDSLSVGNSSSPISSFDIINKLFKSWDSVIKILSTVV